MTVHVLGAGNIGSLIATGLARKTPVQFLLRPATLKRYRDDSASTVRIHEGTSGALWEQQINATDSLKTPIEKLVVTVKTHDIKKALMGIQHAIEPSTEIMIVHNGMGIREQVDEIWPKNGNRPRIGYGVTDAGMRRTGPLWTFNYTGRGRFTFAMPTTSKESELASIFLSSQELLATERVSPALLDLQQRKKLVVNSVVNPLTAILGCPNGALLSLDGLPDYSRIMLKVTNESSHVLDLDRFEMWELVKDVITRTSSNISSMLSDVEQGRTSEIDFINGYIVEQAQKKKLPAPMNMMLRELVKMRIQQSRHEDQSIVPLELDRSPPSYST